MFNKHLDELKVIQWNIIKKEEEEKSKMTYYNFSIWQNDRRKIYYVNNN